MRFRRVGSGVDSRAYGSRDLILRFHGSEQGFRKDWLAHRKFDLPVPEVLEIGRYGEEFYCFSRRLAGTTLQDLKKQQLAATLAPTFDLMRAVANCPVDWISGYGPFDGDGRTQFRSWREFLLSHREGDAELVEIIGRLAEFCPEAHQLVHGDFGSNNVLTDGREITGLLDWSEAMVGDPLWDAANVFFWRGWLDCMAALAAYLEKQMHPLPYWRERVHCYMACIALDEMRG